MSFRSVTTVTATDLDLVSLDGTIRYSITSGNGDGAFTIDGTTGVVRRKINYELHLSTHTLMDLLFS